MKNKWLVLLLVIVMILTACSSSTPAEEEPAIEEPAVEEPTTDESPVEEPEAPESKQFRVAVVMPSAITDLAFSQSMYNSLVVIQDEMGGTDAMEIVYSEGMFVVDDAAAAIRDYASQGFDLVIAHGSQYGSSLQEIAPDFPETSFAWGTTLDTFGMPNVFAYEAASDQGGYVNGVMAASLSQSGVIGVVGPIETGDAKLYVDGFVAGANATNPNIEVNVNWIGSFSDVALAAEAANTHLAAGADVLAGTAQMVVGAIGAAEENGALWFGTQADQSSLAPSIVVANQVYHWEVILQEMISMIQGGTYGGKAFQITLANGGEVVEYNPDYSLPDDIETLAEDTVSGIIDGSISVISEAPAVEEAPAIEMEPLTFGLVLVGPKNDRGWSQAHYDGGLFVEQNLEGAKMIVFESLNPADKPEATLEGVVDDMIAQGAKLIITTSDEFEEDTVGVAEKYPDVVFINSSGDDVLVGGAPANLGNIMGQMVNMKYIAGCAAALATQTSQIGYLGPLINHETRREATAAFLGARYCYENYLGMDPTDLEFTVTWIGFWFNIPGVTLDPTEVVVNFFDSGADVILSGIDTSEAIDGTGRRAARGEAVWSSPYGHIDGCDNAPDVCLGAAFFNWGPAYLETANAVSSGTWEQSWDWNPPYWDDLTDVSKTAVGWKNGPALTADMQTSLDDFISKVGSGDVNLWTGPLNLQDGTEYVADGETATGEQIWYLPQLIEGMEGPSE